MSRMPPKDSKAQKAQKDQKDQKEDQKGSSTENKDIWSTYVTETLVHLEGLLKENPEGRERVKKWILENFSEFQEKSSTSMGSGTVNPHPTTKSSTTPSLQSGMSDAQGAEIGALRKEMNEMMEKIAALEKSSISKRSLQTLEETVASNAKSLYSEIDTAKSDLGSKITNTNKSLYSEIDAAKREFESKLENSNARLLQTKEKIPPLEKEVANLLKLHAELSQACFNMSNAVKSLVKDPSLIELDLYFDFQASTNLLAVLKNYSPIQNYFSLSNRTREQAKTLKNKDDVAVLFFLCPTERWEDELNKPFLLELQGQYSTVLLIFLATSGGTDKIGKVEASSKFGKAMQMLVNTNLTFKDPERNCEAFVNFMEAQFPDKFGELRKKEASNFYSQLEKLATQVRS